MALKFLNDGLFDGKVGIGTTSPNQLLEVAKSSGGATINISTDQSAGSQASKKYVTLDFSGYNNDVMARIQSWDESSNTGHGYLTFSTRKSGVGLSQAMLIDENGNVGIGTTNPGAKLDVVGSVNNADIAVRITNTFDDDNASSEPNAALLLSAVSNNAYLRVHGAPTDIPASHKIDLGSGASDSFLTFSPSNSEKMRILSNGDVKIGVLTDAKLFMVSTGGNGNNERFFIQGYADGGTYGGGFKLSTRNDLNVFNTAVTVNRNGNFGIGTTNPTEKLEVSGNSITRSKTRGLGTNYATPEGWEAGAASTFNFREGFFGGNFINNGPSAENKVEFDDGPFGSRELVWMTVPEVGNDNDGGWDKTMNGFNNATNNGFMSVVYVRRDSGTASGSFYHGLSGQATNNLDGTANTNPYFTAGISVSTLPVDVWCVAIGIIYASSDSNTSSSGLGGVYRLDTGERISTATTFRQKSGATIQRHRAYHFYSTNTTAQLDFARPGFYILDGSEPTLSELTAGAAGGDDVFWSASGNDIYNDNTGNVGIGTTSPAAQLDVAQPLANNSPIIRLTNTDESLDNNQVLGSLEFYQSDPSDGGVGVVSSIRSINENVFKGEAGLSFSTGATGGEGFNSLAERMRIDKDGNVGIGTTSPQTGGGAANWLSLNGTAAYSGGIVYTIGSVTKAYSYFESGFLRHQAQLGSGHNFIVNGNDFAMTILSGGNVGINTSTPQAPLNIHSILNVASGQYNSPSALMLSNGSGATNVGGTILFGADLDSASAASNTQASIYSSNKNSGTLGSYGNLNFATKDTLAATVLTPRMTITHTGNVGIGTTNPAAQLDIESSASTMLRVSATSDVLGEVGGIEFSLAGTRNASIRVNRTVADGRRMDMRFYTGSNSEAMRIREDGNVGIGVTSPGATLDVSGSFRLQSGGSTYLSIGSSSGSPYINTGTSGGTVQFGAPASNTTNIQVQGTVRATGGYKSADGTAGITGTFTFVDKASATRSLTIKNGLITAKT